MISPLLATFEVTNNTLLAGLGIGILSLFLFLIKADKTIRDYIRAASGTKEEPQKRELVPGTLTIKPADRLATFEELKDLRLRVDGIDADLKGISRDIQQTKESLQTEGSRRAASIHKRVDELDKTVSRLDERTENTNAQVHEIGRKTDVILEKLGKR
jgi:methyl-accepting chemotaxis protein